MSATRREQLLGTAARLFAERGFHGVSLHDIGAACGVTGPAIYRHFASKDAMLAQMLVEVSERLLAEALARGEAHPDVHGEPHPEVDALTVLRTLIDWHIEFALEHRALIVVQEREWANLQPAARETVRSLQLAYIDRWVEAVRAMRPELDRTSARASVQAIFGMLNSTPHSARISEPRMRELLARMAESAVLAGAGAADGCQTDDVENVEIGTEQITLGQLLKHTGVADTGGAVKELLAREAVQVNGRLETRRGAQLKRGDVIRCADQEFRLVSPG